MCMLKINVVTAAKENYGNKRDTKNIKYIVIHYTANDGDADESNARYFQNQIVEASAHHFVDDNSTTQSVPDNFVAWSVGGEKYPSCATTGGGKWYGTCTNNNSISVELCDVVRNGKNDFTEKTLANAAELVRSLMKKYNVPIENVIRHFDVVGKVCPKPFVEDVKAWEDFKERLVEAMEKVYNTINELPKWAKPTIQKLIDKGYLSGISDGLGLTETAVKVFVVNDRAGLYG